MLIPPFTWTRPCLVCFLAAAAISFGSPAIDEADTPRLIAKLPTSFGVPTNVTTYEPSGAQLAQLLPAGSPLKLVDTASLAPNAARDALERHAWQGFLRVEPNIEAMQREGRVLGLSAVLLCKSGGDMAGMTATCYLIDLASGTRLDESDQWDPRMSRDSVQVLSDLIGHLVKRYQERS